MYDISNLLKVDGKSIEENITLDINEIDVNGDIIKLEQPLVLNTKLINDNSIVFLEGIFKLDFKINCYLCYEEFSYSQEIYINEIFKQNPDEEEYDIISWKIDLEKVVLDNIVIQIPTQLKCKEDCKGLCQICGKNQNIEKCYCNTENIDSRLAKLKDLL